MAHSVAVGDVILTKDEAARLWRYIEMTEADWRTYPAAVRHIEARVADILAALQAADAVD